MNFTPLCIINENDTSSLAKRFTHVLKLGDIIILSGPVAAGKTAFVKHLAAHLNCRDMITSPTFSIANFYTAPIGKILHIDLYRLQSMEEFSDLGLEDYFDSAVNLIEWGNLIKDNLENYVEMNFELSEESRHHRTVTISCQGNEWKKRHVDISNMIQKFER